MENRDAEEFSVSWSPKGRACLGLLAVGLAGLGRVVPGLRLLGALLLASAVVNRPVRLRVAGPPPGGPLP